MSKQQHQATGGPQPHGTLTAAVAGVLLVLLIVFATPSGQPDDGGVEANKAGLAALTQQEFSDPVLAQRFAPAWDVFHSNAPILTTAPVNLTSTDATLRVQISHKASNPVQLTYEKVYVRNVQTKQWKEYTITNGKDSDYKNFLEGPTWIDIPAQAFGVGDNFVAAYFCTDTVNGAPACGCSGATACGKWNIQRVSAAGIYAPSADSTPPTIAITAPSSGTSSTNTPSITLLATDNVDNQISYQLFVNGVADAAAIGKIPNGSATVVSISALPNGNNIILAQASDVAGNQKNSSAITLTVNIVDSSPPSAPSNLSNQGVTANSIALSWNPAADNTGGSGIDYYRVYRNAVNVYNTTDETVTTLVDTGRTPLTTYSYTVDAVDNAGNEGPQSASLSVTTSAAQSTDTTPPTAVISSPASGAVLNTATPTIAFTVSDDKATSINYDIYRDSIVVHSAIAASGQGQLEPLPTTADGTHTIIVQATDGVNTINSSTTTISIDTTAPSLSANKTTTGSLTYNSVGIEVKTNEQATCKYATTAGLSFQVMTPFTTTGASAAGNVHSTTVQNLNANSPYTFYVVCQDTVGNTAGGVQIYATTLNQVPCTLLNQVGTACYPSANPPSPFSCPSASPGICTWTCGLQGSLNQQCAATSATVSGYECIANTCRQVTPSCAAAADVGKYCGSGTITANGYTCVNSVCAAPACTPQCPSAATVTCGQQITPTNACGSCSGTGTLCTGSLICQSGVCKDLTPPSVTGVTTPTSTLAVGTTSTTLTITTNEQATCAYSAVAGTAYNSMTQFSTTNSQTHTTTVGNLVAGANSRYVKCADTSANTMTADYTVTISVGQDTTPPVATITQPSANQVLPAGTTSTTLAVSTDEAATCKYSTSNQAYNNMASTFSSTGGTSHSTTLAGLTNGGTYTYYVRCRDPSTNAMQTSQSVSFSVVLPDTTPPAISSVTMNPSSGYLQAGSVATITITADATGYSASSVTVNGVATTNFRAGTANTYLADYTVQASDTNRAANAIPISVALRDQANNVNSPYTTVSGGTPAIDTVAPTVQKAQIVLPALLAYAAGSTVSVDVVFSEPVSVTGVPALQLSLAGKSATYSTTSGSAARFTYVVANGDNDPDLNYASTTALSGTIRDAAGNTAVLTLPPTTSSSSLAGTSNIVIDTTPPVVSITSPSGGSTVSSATTITASVTDATTIQQVVFTADADSTTDYSAPYQATWDPSAPSITAFVVGGGGGGSATQHTITVTATDLAGNSASRTITVWYDGLL